MYIKYNRGKGIAFSERIDVRPSENNFYTFTAKNVQIILSGKFYYYNLANSKPVLFSAKPESQLGKLVRKHSIENFINNVEGEYIGVRIDSEKQSLTLFSDKLKQSEFYYFYNNDFFVASDDPREIVEDMNISKYDSNVLASAVMFYVPKGHLLFKGVRRLKYNESVTVIKNKVAVTRFRDKDQEIARYSEKDLDRYYELYKNSILSRASKKFNLVFASGGWDSTSLLFMLSRYLGKDKVRGITIKMVMSDGSCFNEFEVKKVLSIGKILGIKIEIVEVNYGKRDLYSKFDEVKDILFYKNIFYFSPANWSKVVGYIRDKYGEDVVVFNGEASDSLHNYGFSQYISIPHENDDFAEYADQMKNYLFGPTFFKKVMDNTFLSDAVYKIFLNLNKDKEFVNVKNLNAERRKYLYLLSFIFSDLRIPFRALDYTKYIKTDFHREFERWLEKEYFAEPAENINKNNLYYYFSYLYVLFHLQSPQVQIFRNGLRNVRFPFIDLNMFKFLYKMPESFGRGLNFNSIKYPLKTLVRKKFPKELITVVGTGPHSYLSEVRDVNIYDDYLLQGPIYAYIKDNLDFKRIRRDFPRHIFHVDKIEEFVNNFKQGRLKNISRVDGGLLIMLTLLSIHSKA